MIARVADHCFWLGRYLERVDSTARVLHVTQHLSLDAELTPERCWGPVLVVAGERPPFVARYSEGSTGDGELVQHYMTWDEDNWTSLVRSIGAARENARSIREVVSLEVWETVNELWVWVQSPAAREEYAASRYGFYRTVRRAAELCRGLFASTMLHDAPLDFIHLGMWLERAGQTARIVDVHHHALSVESEVREVVETGLWLSLLRSCSGFEPFMKRHRGRVTARAVAAFLVLEPGFPRSMRHAVSEALACLRAIHPPSAHALPGGRSLARLASLDASLGARGPETLHPLHDLATYVVDETAAICEELGKELLGHAPPPSQTAGQAQPSA